MERRYQAVLSCLGTSQITYRRPSTVAWWSAAFPGFGHMLLNMHLKGNILFLFEVIINVNANLNLSMVYTFSGQFELAKSILNTRWIMIYIPFYIFCIWDSYRSAMDVNKLYSLTEHQPVHMPVFIMKNLELCYLDKRIPFVASIWSLFLPGLGQLYNRRTLTAFAFLVWTLVITFYSRDLESLQLLFGGDFIRSTETVNIEWLLFIPSLSFGAAFDAYVTTMEYNKLFNSEQKEFLREEWQSDDFKRSFLNENGEWP